MHRIDHPTATPAIPALAPAGDPGYFTEGDPGGAAPATVVTADWANAVQEEIANVIEGAGITLDKTQRNQLLLAIEAIISGGSSDALLKAQNLADLTNVTAARAALGLGTAAVASTGSGATNVPTVAIGDARWVTMAQVNAAIATALTAYLPKNNPTFTGTMTGPSYNKAP